MILLRLLLDSLAEGQVKNFVKNLGEKQFLFCPFALFIFKKKSKKIKEKKKKKKKKRREKLSSIMSSYNFRRQKFCKKQLFSPSSTYQEDQSPKSGMW